MNRKDYNDHATSEEYGTKTEGDEFVEDSSSSFVPWANKTERAPPSFYPLLFSRETGTNEKKLLWEVDEREETHEQWSLVQGEGNNSGCESLGVDTSDFCSADGEPYYENLDSISDEDIDPLYANVNQQPIYENTRFIPGSSSDDDDFPVYENIIFENMNSLPIPIDEIKPEHQQTPSPDSGIYDVPSKVLLTVANRPFNNISQELSSGESTVSLDSLNSNNGSQPDDSLEEDEKSPVQQDDEAKSPTKDSLQGRAQSVISVDSLTVDFDVETVVKEGMNKEEKAVAKNKDTDIPITMEMPQHEKEETIQESGIMNLIDLSDVTPLPSSIQHQDLQEQPDVKVIQLLCNGNSHNSEVTDENSIQVYDSAFGVVEDLHANYEKETDLVIVNQFVDDKVDENVGGELTVVENTVDLGATVESNVTVIPVEQLDIDNSVVELAEEITLIDIENVVVTFAEPIVVDNNDVILEGPEAAGTTIEVTETISSVETFIEVAENIDTEAVLGVDIEIDALPSADVPCDDIIEINTVAVEIDNTEVVNVTSNELVTVVVIEKEPENNTLTTDDDNINENRATEEYSIETDEMISIDGRSYRNIGAQIMESYEKDRRGKRDSLNLPDVSLLDMDASLEDIERERRLVIGSQVVRAKKKDSWIKTDEYGFEMCFSSDSSSAPVSPRVMIISEIEKTSLGIFPDLNNKPVTAFVVPSATKIKINCNTKTPEGDVVIDSILDNKEKTKSYWESVMTTSAATNQTVNNNNNNNRATKPVISQTSETSGFDSDSVSSQSEQDIPDIPRSPIPQKDSQSEPFVFISEEEIHFAEPSNMGSTEPDSILLDTSADESLLDPRNLIEMEIRHQKQREQELKEIGLLKTFIDNPEEELHNLNLEESLNPDFKEDEILNGYHDEDDEPIYEDTSLVPPPPYYDTNDVIPNALETKIAIEIRELREREEELRQQRILRLSSSKGLNEENTMYASITTTDEAFSEYGSEEKELICSSDGNNSSRMMSPEVPLSHSHGAISMDSLSSGHSSGSSGEHSTPRKIHVKVKPLDEPEEEPALAYTRTMNETPIEREIRLGREREEELRKDQKFITAPSTPIAEIHSYRNQQIKPSLVANNNIHTFRSLEVKCDFGRDVQHRLATSRIQQEIEETNQREKELIAAGTIHTMSKDTVDEKVTRFTDLAKESQTNGVPRDISVMKKWATATQSTPFSSISSTSTSSPDTSRSATPSSQNHYKLQNGNSSNRILSLPIHTNVPPSAPSTNKRFFGAQNGSKGMMEKFIASRGKLAGISTFNKPSPVYHHMSSPTEMKVPLVVEKKTPDVTMRQNGTASLAEKSTKQTYRKSFSTAEDRIQAELREMEKRETELRLHRQSSLTLSQPNLFDPEESSLQVHSVVSLSNPNLLDDDNSFASSHEPNSDNQALSLKGVRRRSALIAQWENMIQQNTTEAF